MLNLKNNLFSWLLRLCIIIVFCIPIPSIAQIGSSAPGAHFVLHPSLPSPNSSVEVSLDTYSVNTTGATIHWYVNDQEQVSYRNERSLLVDLGSLGEKTVVRAVVVRNNSPAFSVIETITPAVIDLILETNTTIPIFYKGRALPSQGSYVRAIAVPHSRSFSNPSDFTYTWKLNDQVLFGGPLTGKPVADITMPDYKNALLSVEIHDSVGSLVGKKTILLSGFDPELYFYETNPLRGMNRKAIPDELIFTGEEATIRAIPYYIDLGTEGQYEWRLNGSLVNTTGDDPNEITLRTTGTAGRASVSFEYKNIKKLFQHLDESFTILFE